MNFNIKKGKLYQLSEETAFFIWDAIRESNRYGCSGNHSCIMIPKDCIFLALQHYDIQEPIDILMNRTMMFKIMLGDGKVGKVCFKPSIPPIAI